MAAPSVAYDSFELEDFLPHADFDAELLTQIRNNQEHLYEIAHAGGYGGGSGHTHASSGAAAVDLPVHENLLLHSCPSSGNARSLNNGNTWEFSGFASNDLFQDTFGAVIGGNTSGQYMYQVVGGNDAGESVGMFGTGAGDGMDCVVSFFVRPLSGLMAGGSLSFGFADNSTSTFSQSATLGYATIFNTWTRVYSRFTAAGQGHSTDVRFLLRVSTGYTFGLMVTGFQINRGRHLVPWTISNMEGTTPHQANTNYNGMPDCPLLDQRISMDDAVDVTP